MTKFIEKHMSHLQGYKHDVILLLRVLRKHQSIDQHHFDRIFGGGTLFPVPRVFTSHTGEVTMKEPRFTFRQNYMEDYMLTFNENSDKELAIYISIVQMMAGTDVVSISKSNDTITYSWTDMCADVLEKLND